MSKNDGPAASSFLEPSKRGWLTKHGGSGLKSSWKKRWFVLDHHYLFYYESGKDKHPKGIICLPDYKDCRRADKTECAKKFSLALIPDPDMVEPGTTARTYYIYGDSDDECDGWVKAILDEMRPTVGIRKHQDRSKSLPQPAKAVTKSLKVKTKDLDVVTSAASEGPQLVHLTKGRAAGPAKKRPPRRYKPMDEDDDVGTPDDDGTKKDSGFNTMKAESGSSSPQRSVKKPVLPPSTSKPNLDILASTNQQQQPPSNPKSPPAPPPKPSKEADSSEAKKTSDSSKEGSSEPVTEAATLKETTAESEVKETSLKKKTADTPVIKANQTANPLVNEESSSEVKRESLKEVAKEPVDHPDGDIPIPFTQPTTLIGNPPITRPKPPMKHAKPKISVPHAEGKAVTPEVARKNIETKETMAVTPENVVKEIPEAATEKTADKAPTDLEKSAEKVSDEDKKNIPEKIAEKDTTEEDDNDVVPLTTTPTTDVSTDKSVAPKTKPKPKAVDKDVAKENGVIEVVPQATSPPTSASEMSTEMSVAPKPKPKPKTAEKDVTKENDDTEVVQQPTSASDASAEKSAAPKPKPKPRSSTKTQFDIPKAEEEVAEDKKEQDIPVVSYSPDSDSRGGSTSPGTTESTANSEDKANGIPSPTNDKQDTNDLIKSEASKDNDQANTVTSNRNAAAEVDIVDDSGNGLYSVVTLNRRSEEREGSPTGESTNQQQPARTHLYDSVSLSPRPSPSPEEPEYDVIGDVRIKEPLSAKDSNYDNWKLKKFPPKQSSTAEDEDSYAVIDHVPAVSVNIPDESTSSETQQLSVTSPVPLSVAASTIPQYAQVCKNAKKKSTSPDGGPQAEDGHFDLLFDQLGSSVPDHLNQAKEILRLAQVVRQEAEQMKKEAAEDREIARKERIDAETMKKNAAEILKQAKEKAAAS